MGLFASKEHFLPTDRFKIYADSLSYERSASTFKTGVKSKPGSHKINPICIKPWSADIMQIFTLEYNMQDGVHTVKLCTLRSYKNVRHFIREHIWV